MATTIKLKNSVTTTNAPSSLVQGEVAINITDKKVWVGNAATTPIQLLGDGGSASFTSIAFGAGTVSSPSITFTGDTNTGIYSPAADTIAFTEGGVESMRIDSSGNVGIGTSSPSTQLQMNSSAATYSDQLRVRNTNFGNADIGVGSGIMAIATDMANITFYTSSNLGTTGSSVPSNERMRIDSSGNVGIGTSSPGAKLQVAGGDILVSTVGNKVNFATTGSSTVNYVGGAADGFSLELACQRGASQPFVYKLDFANGHIWSTAGSERMRIDSSGNVGIGTSSYSDRFIVMGGARANTGIVASLGAGATSSVACKLHFSDTWSWNWTVGGNSAGAFVFTSGEYGTVTGSERMRITSGGDLLIACTNTNETTSVGIRAEVTGAFSVTRSESTNVASTLDVYSTGAGAYRFYVNMAGTVFATNTTISGISDQRVKENIVDLDEGLNAVMALKPRKFDWKEGKGKGIKGDRGFIAQEFETVFPDMIEEWKDTPPEGEEPYKAVNANLIPTLVKAIQEQQAMIEELKQEVAKLKGV